MGEWDDKAGMDGEHPEEGELVPATGVRSRRGILGLFSAAAGLGFLSRAGLAAPGATAARLHDHGTHTRFVLELTDGAEFSVFLLPDPYRLVIDLPEMAWDFPAEVGENGDGLVRDFRFGLFQPGQSRVVLDLSGPAGVRKAFLLQPTGSTPWRLVVDVAPLSREAFLGQAGVAQKMIIKGPEGAPTLDNLPAQAPDEDMVIAFDGPKAPEHVPLPERKPAATAALRKPVIVIDPGHGGVDPGAIGVSGVNEKTITLSAARQLKAKLEATGRYRAILTRSRDVSLGLRQRREIARRAAADVFISLHADSINNKSVRGLSVYTLSENASDREAALLAETENKADLIIGMDLSHESDEVRNILIDLAQRESLNLSAKLANRLIAELRRETALLRNTHRFAGFAVLKSPDVPSVLLEMGYLSNREEERSLRQEAYRAKLVTAMVRSFDQYFAQVQAVRGT